MVRKILSVCAAALLAGCHSFSIVQTNVFSDEDGNLVQVAYGKSDTEHVNTFLVPSNGKRMEFKSKLMVKVSLPEITRVYKKTDDDGKVSRRTEKLCDEDSFVAWQTMNILSSGTMYKTDNDKWMVYVNGFTCAIYLQTKEEATRYLEVYRGVLCDTPEMKDVRKNDKVRDLPRQDKKFIAK